MHLQKDCIYFWRGCVGESFSRVHLKTPWNPDLLSLYAPASKVIIYTQSSLSKYAVYPTHILINGMQYYPAQRITIWTQLEVKVRQLSWASTTWLFRCPPQVNTSSRRRTRRIPVAHQAKMWKTAPKFSTGMNPVSGLMWVNRVSENWCFVSQKR